MPDTLLALWDGMAAHPWRALVIISAINLIAALAFCTLIGLIPLGVWGLVISWPLAWLFSGPLVVVLGKLVGCGVLIMAAYVAMDGWWHE